MIIILTDWVKNIIFVVLFASFLELLLPNSSMQRFVRVIMGLFIMLAIITPVIDLVQHPVLPVQIPTLSSNSSNANIILDDANHFVHGREKLSSELYKKELAQQMQVMIIALDGVADAKVIVETDQNTTKGKVSRVVVYITPGLIGNKNQVKKIIIGDERKTEVAVDMELKNKVKNLLAELYQLPKEVVVVQRLHQ